MAKLVRTNFKVLDEVISSENVQEMAELLAFKETKWLMSKLGEFASITHRNLYFVYIKRT